MAARSAAAPRKGESRATTSMETVVAAAKRALAEALGSSAAATSAK